MRPDPEQFTVLPPREPVGVSAHKMTRADVMTLRTICSQQMYVELVRSRSVALASDVLRSITAARAAFLLSEHGYLVMVCAIADILSPEGARQ